jgi:hypothetical protein
LWDAESEHHAAEGAVLASEIEGEVAARDDLHLHPEKREERTQPEEAKAFVLKRIKSAAKPAERRLTLTSRFE